MSEQDEPPCPHCGADHEHSVLVDPERITPDPGDLRLCILCGQLAVWTDERELRKPTDRETRSLRSTPSVRKWMKAWQSLQPHASAAADD